PFSAEFNLASFKEYKADIIVTKAAGKTGGLEEKLKAASQLGMPVIIIERPEIDYPISFNKVKELVEYLEGIKNGERKITCQ
ncbi:MAG: precorrin-6A/cobalt-precorrin-6A reductase, partial [Halarsenatibacteraceae bacterium]